MKTTLVNMALVAAILFLCSYKALAELCLPTESTRVLATIDKLLKDPVSESTLANMAIITRFAQESDSITVEVKEPYYDFSDSDYSTLLLGFYIAGYLQSVLLSPDNTNSATHFAAGARATLLFYEICKKKGVALTNEFYDTLLEAKHLGTLDSTLTNMVNRLEQKE